MLNALLYLSTGLIFFAYLGYFLLIYINNKKISDQSGLDILTEVLSEYNGINVILSKGFFSYYNLQRKIIKLTPKCYYGNTVSDFSIALIEAGFFISDKIGNKFMELCRKVIPTLKLFYLLPIIAIVISNSIYNSGDSFFGIILLFLFIFIAFLLIDLKNQNCSWVIKNININSKKINNVNKIITFIKNTIILEWMIIIGEAIMIVRFLLLMTL